MSLMTYDFWQYGLAPDFKIFRRCLLTCGGIDGESLALATGSIQGEPAVFVEQDVIYPDLSPPAEIADQIPVDGRSVEAPRFRVAGAQRHMEAAGDLFVEKDLLGEAPDAFVGADGKLDRKSVV